MPTPIGPDNAAEMARDAEELGEVVQRTRDSMAGEMHAYGTDASSAMDSAIDRISGGSVTVSLADLGVTVGQLTPARPGLEIAEALSGDTRVSSVLSAAEGIRGGMDAALVR